MSNMQAPAGAAPSKDEKTWGMLCHLSAFAGFIVPFGGILGPLVVWLIKKNEMPFADDQGKESLNFQITIYIAALICIPLIFVLIGIPLIILVGLFWLIMTIVASIKANDGVHYRYPFALRLIK
jgi:hypothetical protein